MGKVMGDGLMEDPARFGTRPSLVPPKDHPSSQDAFSPLVPKAIQSSNLLLKTAGTRSSLTGRDFIRLRLHFRFKIIVRALKSIPRSGYHNARRSSREIAIAASHPIELLVPVPA